MENKLLDKIKGYVELGYEIGFTHTSLSRMFVVKGKYVIDENIYYSDQAIPSVDHVDEETVCDIIDFIVREIDILKIKYNNGKHKTTEELT